MFKLFYFDWWSTISILSYPNNYFDSGLLFVYLKAFFFTVLLKSYQCHSISVQHDSLSMRIIDTQYVWHNLGFICWVINNFALAHSIYIFNSVKEGHSNFFLGQNLSGPDCTFVIYKTVVCQLIKWFDFCNFEYILISIKHLFASNELWLIIHYVCCVSHVFTLSFHRLVKICEKPQTNVISAIF